MSNWKQGLDYPSWMNEDSLHTLKGGYLLEGESPKDLYVRVSKAAAKYAGTKRHPRLEEIFFDLLWKNWLCPASPVLSNMGTKRGMPVSCFGVTPADSLESIFDKAKEAGMMSKNGGGVGIGLHNLRPRGAPVNQNGVGDGVIPWCKFYESASAAKQGGVRKGAFSVNLPVEHPDFKDFLQLKNVEGDPYQRTPKLHLCAMVSDAFMEKVLSGEPEARGLWQDLIMTRWKRGEPYLVFEDTANRSNPRGYNRLGLKVTQSNICSEILLASDPDHSFVCVLSSLNLARFDEWKSWSVLGKTASDLPYFGTLFLEGVASAFIDQAKHLPAFANAVRFTEKSRAIGLGVLGYHALLQQVNTPWDSLLASLLNRQIFSCIRDGAEAASRDLAEELGEPEWCRGTGFRHTHRTAVAPTFSNSIISSVDTQSIEPLLTNRGSVGSAKGGLSRRNPRLEVVLEAEYGKNVESVWNDILANDGSVCGLDFLSPEHKDVYKTAFEIDQRALIKSAAERQPYIDQSQSLNVFFAHDAHPKYVNETHIMAYKLGVKTLYYFRSSAPLKADAAGRSSSTPTTEYPKESEECRACEG